MPQLPALDNTYGALLIGVLAAIALWGVTCTQTWTYFARAAKEKDNAYFRCLIAFLWVLDTFDSALDVHIVYYYLVVNFMNPLAILTVVWSVVTHILITSVTNFIVRCLYIRQVFRLSNCNYFLLVWLCSLSLLELVTGIVITVKAFQLESFVEISSISHLFYLDFAANIVGDGSVALSLIYFLWIRKTTFAQTNRLIHTFIVYAVNTGLLVAVDATIGMVTYITMPQNMIFLAFYLLLGKLYLNSYLASINARDHLRNQSQGPLSIHLSQITSSRYDYPQPENRHGALDSGTMRGPAVNSRDAMNESIEKMVMESPVDEERGSPFKGGQHPYSTKYAQAR